MSGRGNCSHNAMAPNFFSILKAEYVYRLNLKMLAEVRETIDAYIHCYNYDRVQFLTGVTPLSLCHSA